MMAALIEARPMATSNDHEMLVALDQYVAANVPAIMVPNAGQLEPLREVGHRFLVAADGLYIEFKRAWCHGIQLVSKSGIRLPYGTVGPRLTFDCGPPPASLLKEFRRHARHACPMEIAAWIVWREGACDASAWRLVMLNSRSSSGDHVEFDRPVLPAGEHLVVDIHSHGRHGAFFSPTDNVQDKELAEVKISLVYGNLDQENVSQVRRLCALGLLTGVSHDVRNSD